MTAPETPAPAPEPERWIDHGHSWRPIERGSSVIICGACAELKGRERSSVCWSEKVSG